MLKPESTDFANFLIHDESLLAAIIRLLREKRFATTAAFALKKVLNISIENLNSPYIYNLLLTPLNELLVQELISGFKEVERLIYLHPMTKKRNLSSAFRSLISETGSILSGDVPIARCPFQTRFSIKEPLNMAEVPCSSSDIYVIRVNPRNNKSSHTIIDPDTLQGVIQPTGLLSISLNKVQENSLHTWVEGSKAQSWLITLQVIASEKNTESILYLFNSSPELLDSTDILRAFIQLKETLQRSKRKSVIKRVNEIFNLLTLGGSTKSGHSLEPYRLPSHLISNSEFPANKYLHEAEKYLTFKVLVDESVRYYYVNFGPLNECSLLFKTLIKYSLKSNDHPVKYRNFKLLRTALKVILTGNNLKADCFFLAEEHDYVSKEHFIEYAEKINKVISKHVKTNDIEVTNELFDILSKYGGLAEVVSEFFEKTKVVLTRESSVIIDTNSPIISKLLTLDGLLYTCFSNSKWDNLSTDSNSLESYVSRISVSKILVFLANHQNIPFTRTLLLAPPEDIKPSDIYFFYAEMISILSCREDAHTGVNGFMAFLNKYGGKIYNGQSFDCLVLFSRLSDYGNFLYVTEREYTLQLVHGDNESVKYVPIDSNYLPGTMLPHSLLIECLKVSESTPMSCNIAIELRKELSDISQYSCPKLKNLLNSDKANITDAIIISGLIEYESMLDSDAATTQKTKVHKSALLRTFLQKWTGKIAGKSSINEHQFTTRFNRDGEVKCVPPIRIHGEMADNQRIDISFNTYLNPAIYTPDGLLTKALLFIKSRVSNYSKVKIQQWEALINFILKHQYPNSPFLNVGNFLSTPLKVCNRTKVVQALQTIEKLIKLKESKDKESDFYALMELFSLENKTINDGRTISALNYQCCFSELPEQENVLFKVTNKINGKVVLSDFKLDILPIKKILSNDGVLNVALHNLARQSLNSPIFGSEINNIKLMVKIINDKFNESVISIEEHQANSSLHYLLTSSVKQLNQRNVRQGFTRLEKIIEGCHRNDKGQFSEGFRRFLSINSHSISSGLKINECGFKTQFSSRKERKSIELIIPISETSGEVIPPPAMDNFDSISNLKDKISEYYQLPIVAIIKAAQEEMNLYQKLRDELSPLVNRDNNGNFTVNIPQEVQSWVSQTTREHRKNKTTQLISYIDTFGREIVLGAFLQLRANTPVNDILYCQGKSHLINPDFKVWFKNNGSSMKSFFWTPFILPRPVLLICFIRLIIHTTWNKDVIASLQGRDLPYPLPTTSFFIQGYKDKVEKKTTPVEVTHTDKEVREAIELISLHFHNMKELGFNPESIWETPDSTRFTFLNASQIDDFILRYKLPKFRIEQLAKHQINVRKGVDGSIHQSQIERNHAQMKTTAGYVDHPLARIYYDANNADFQRRLEATVTFRHLGAEALQEYGIPESDIDLKLLGAPSDEVDLPQWFLLPDGSTCVDIWAPIDKPSKSQQWCSGRKCHSNNGCPHNKVLISIEEFVHTLRHQRWFIERYDKLIIKYTREYFDEYIAPAMRFTFGLTRFVQTANPEIYRAAELLLTTKLSGDE